MIGWAEPPTVVCAWCGATKVDEVWLRPLGRPPLDAFLSHGICPDCATGYLDADLPLSASVKVPVAHA